MTTVITTVITKSAATSSWEKIREADYPVGTIITDTLKDGTPVTFEIAAADVYGAKKAIVLSDCLPGEQRMNVDWTNKGGWPASEMRNKRMEEIFNLLPDELQAIIVPRTIKQRIGGKIVESVDKVWLPSATEMFGEGAWGTDADVDDVHFPLYSTEKSRVKELPGRGTWWYWLRSPYTGSSYNFYSVTASGSSYANGAYIAYGVAFGFLI